MWCNFRMHLLPLILLIGLNFQNVHTGGVQIDDGPIFPTALREILNLFDIMVRETTANIDSSVIPSCSVQPTDEVNKSPNLSSDSGPFIPQRICVISKEEFDEIWNALQKENVNKVDSTIVTSPDCTDLDKIQIGILKLKSLFKEILKHEVSSAKYEELKVSYEQKLRNFQKQVDEVKQAVSGAEAGKIVKIHDELQLVFVHVNAYFKKIEEYQNTANEEFVRQVVTDISKNGINSAQQVFNFKITNKSQVRRIISSVYNGPDSIIDKILPFLRGVKDTEGILLGYTSLYDEMKSKNEMSGLNILLMSVEVFQKRNVENFKGLVESLTEALKELHNNNGFNSFYQFAKTHDVVKAMMSIYVHVGFDGNIANTEKILDLMPKFDKLIHKIYLLNDLISELKVTGITVSGGEYTREMFTMVYNVIQLRRSLSPDDDQITRHAMIELENNIPDVLRDLMFQNLCIQNSHDGSYLYAGDTSDENGRLVLTSNSSEKYGQSLSWQIEFTDNGRKVLLKNEKYNEVLYLLEAGDPREGRLLQSENNDDIRAQFTIELINSFWNAFGIFSPKYNEYLDMSDLDDDDTRKVLATPVLRFEELEHVPVPKQIWVIKSCRIPV